MTLGPWLANNALALPLVTVPTLDTSRQTTVGSSAVLLARASRTSTARAPGSRALTLHVTTPPERAALPVPEEAVVQRMPRVSGSRTEKERAALPVLRTRNRDG